MKKTLSGWVLVPMLTCIGCPPRIEQATDSPKTAPISHDQNIPRPNQDPQSNQPGVASKMANPASVFCIEQGGKHETQKDEKGEFGVCVFPDGSRCEEWRLFRKACAPGQCFKPSGRCENPPKQDR